MPILIKILFTVFVLWSTIYSASYCAFQIKKKNVRGAVTISVLSLIMIVTFGLSLMTI